MPLHMDLGDPEQYLFTQTDMILQLCSKMDFVNRWVFKTDSYPITPSEERRYEGEQLKPNAEKKAYDISAAVSVWAIVTDIHSGFQRLDGRNMMGFMDGISQPERLLPINTSLVESLITIGDIAANLMHRNIRNQKNNYGGR